jgi:hypothetical protein
MTLYSDLRYVSDAPNTAPDLMYKPAAQGLCLDIAFADVVRQHVVARKRNEPIVFTSRGDIPQSTRIGIAHRASYFIAGVSGVFIAALAFNTPDWSLAKRLEDIPGEFAQAMAKAKTSVKQFVPGVQ